MADLTRLTADVQAAGAATDAAVALLDNIAAQLKAAGTDQVALDALAAAIEAETKKLTDATVADGPPVA